MRLNFKRKIKGGLRSELGEKNFLYKNDTSEFLETTVEPVTFRITINGEKEELFFEALPASSFNNQNIWRCLKLAPDYENSSSLLGEHNTILPTGISNILFSIDKVGETITGEEVTLEIIPPITSKSSIPGYRLLWWFFFWPIYAIILVFYGFRLAYKK